MISLKNILVALLVSMFAFACKPDNEKQILIYTKNGEGYVHENIAASVAALEKICAAEGILTEVSEQPSVFTPENLERYDAAIAVLLLSMKLWILESELKRKCGFI